MQKKYRISHEHEYGITTYTVVTSQELFPDLELDDLDFDYKNSITKKQCDALEINFEPHKEEWLSVEEFQDDEIIDLDALMNYKG